VIVKPTPSPTVGEVFAAGATDGGDPAVGGQGDLVAVRAQHDEGALEHRHGVDSSRSCQSSSSLSHSGSSGHSPAVILSGGSGAEYVVS